MSELLDTSTITEGSPIGEAPPANNPTTKKDPTMTDQELAKELRNLATDAHLSGNSEAHRVLALASIRLEEISLPYSEQLFHPSAGETALLRHHLASLDLIADILKPRGDQ
jgi:hypothetical protein